jgi:hypothetical protein
MDTGALLVVIISGVAIALAAAVLWLSIARRSGHPMLSQAMA